MASPCREARGAYGASSHGPQRSGEKPVWQDASRRSWRTTGPTCFRSSTLTTMRDLHGSRTPPSGSSTTLETRAGPAWVDEVGVSKLLRVSRQTIEDEVKAHRF